MKISKYRSYSINVLIVFAILAIYSIACNKLIAIDQPVNAITADKLFQDSASAALAMNGMLIQMDQNSTFASNLVNLTAGLSADELTYNGTAAAYTEFANNDIDAGNTTVRRLWTYSLIYQANAIIEKVNNATSLSPYFSKQLLGTAEFIRSFYYFYLINMFGKVPLITSTDYSRNATIARTSIDSVYNHIIGDLKNAADDLPVSFDTKTNKAGITSWAAKALLARVYLYRQDWQNAYALSNEIISTSVFGFPADLDKVFIANSEDAIWQLAPLDGQACVYEGYMFIPSSGLIPQYQLRNSLVQSFEPGDMRRTQWIGITNISGKDYYFPFKYKVSGFVGTPTEYYVIFRLAEQYLIRAEAEVQLNQSENALKDIDKIRTRAGLLPLTGNGISYSKDELLQLILTERKHELFCEWGHRWFDLKRTEKIDQVMQAAKENWRPSAALYPVPDGEIRRNPYLDPNP